MAHFSSRTLDFKGPQVWRGPCVASSTMGMFLKRGRWKRRLTAFSVVLIALAAVLAHWLLARPMTYAAHQERAQADLDIVHDDDFEEDVFIEEYPDEGSDSAASSGDSSPAPRPVEVLAVPATAEESALPLHPSIRTTRAQVEYGDAENYLLVGIDHTRGTWGRADTIVVAIFDEESGHAGLVSVPRDLYVDVPGNGPARINATLRIAARQGKNPLDVLRGVVEDVLSIDVEHVIVGDLRVFEGTVNALGGLDVDVPCALIDNFIDERTESGRRVLNVEAGRQAMNGATAAMYARSRHGRSDWDRSRRQHAVLSALRRKVREVGVARWVPALGAALEDGVITTMSRLELLRLIRRVARLDDERLHGLLIGSRQVDRHRTSEGRSVLLPNYDAIDAALSGLFEAPAPGVSPRPRRCRPTDIALEHRAPSAD